MTGKITASDPILSEAQFLGALRLHLLNPVSRKGVTALLRVRVNAYTATVSRLGERSAREMLLLPAADRLRNCVRSSDLVAHATPGIFLVLIKNMNTEEDLSGICGRIVRQGMKSFDIASARTYSGFSVGAAIIRREHSDATELLSIATENMYRHNRYGEGGFDLYPDESAEVYSDPAEIEACISDALRMELFELDFQPRYGRDDALVSAVAKVRMRRADGKRLKGEAFLQRIEKTKPSVQMSARALQQLFDQTGDWLRRGIRIPSISIAVSGPHFLRADFPQTVSAMLRDAGVPGTLLEMELTESTITTDLKTARRTGTDLADLGVRFVLCGVSPGPVLTSCLKRLPIGTLQLSCSPHAVPSVTSLPLLRAVISYGHRLGLRVISKDIESEEQRKALYAAGCDGFQGPFLSEPLSRKKMEEVLQPQSSQ